MRKKFATEAMVKKYDNLVQENRTLGNKLAIKEGLVNSLKAENEKLAEEIKTLRSAKEAALQQVHNLRNRGFWARLINK